MEVVGDDELELFRSRNRGSFEFKDAPENRRFFRTVAGFQSRNRGSFEFKATTDDATGQYSI